MSQTHQPRHRHQPRTEQVANDNDKGNDNKEADNDNNDGKSTADENVAFSDTTSATTYSFDEANSTDDANSDVNDSPLNFKHYDNPFCLVRNFVHHWLWRHSAGLACHRRCVHASSSRRSSSCS